MNKVIICYVLPLTGNPQYLEHAVRFLNTYHSFPAGFPHESLVVCNGNAPDDETQFMFSGMENVRFLQHDNSGYDLGAFQHAARENPADLMVFFGVSTYLKGPGWLARMVDARMKHGDTLYGTTANRGVVSMGVQPHIRTTGFWISTALFNQYPHQVTDPSHRYAFEHGETCFTTWIKNRGLSPWLVTWAGEYREQSWDDAPNGFHRGNQSNLLCGDRLTMPPFFHQP